MSYLIDEYNPREGDETRYVYLVPCDSSLLSIPLACHPQPLPEPIPQLCTTFPPPSSSQLNKVLAILSRPSYDIKPFRPNECKKVRPFLKCPVLGALQDVLNTLRHDAFVHAICSSFGSSPESGVTGIHGLWLAMRLAFRSGDLL